MCSFFVELMDMPKQVCGNFSIILLLEEEFASSLLKEFMCIWDLYFELFKHLWYFRIFFSVADSEKI